ncbi:hydroxyisourate hydrolase [Serratia aquatilis]|uniref:5-hydroxyisourate hydrolase n=1 Tax=Serratia aquatilis TaxID=1737515 RepID=A0ABV6E9S3_9GAMM
MKVIVPILLASLSFSVVAAESANPLSVHILNQQTGLPSKGVVVELEKQEGSEWKHLADAVTDDGGRIGALYPSGKDMSVGVYKVTFKTGEYFSGNKQETFFPEIPVIFKVTTVNQKLHIPLLLSQYGYSTYRGS